MSISVLQLVARIVAERVLNSIPQGLLIAAVAWLLLRVFAIRSSATRFLVWFSALLAVAATPFLPNLSMGRLTHAFSSQVRLSSFWAVALFASLLVMTAVVMSRFAVGLWKLRRLRRNCLPVTASGQVRELQEILAPFGGARKVSLCTSPDVRVPTAIGFFKPLVILPEWSLRELSREELKVILLHEFAHLRRMDDWTNLAQQLVRTIFFFHPAVIWIGTRLSLEREMACDDVVLAETGNPRAYAECLVKIAEKTLVGRALAMGQAVISHARQTCQRLGRILDADRATSASTCKPALGISIFLVVFCLVALPRVPKLVVVDNTGRTPVVTSATDIAPRAAVIPAVARLASGSAFMPVASSGRAVAADRPHRFVQTVSRRKRSHPRQSLFARAVVRQTSRPVELVVLTRTTEFEASGSAIMTISVWRVTLVRPNRATTGVARSI